RHRSIGPQSPAGSVISPACHVSNSMATMRSPYRICRSSPQTVRPRRAKCPATEHRPDFVFTVSAPTAGSSSAARTAPGRGGRCGQSTEATMRGPCCGARLRPKFASATLDANREHEMPKAYWVVTYRSVKNTEAWKAYAKLAVPAIENAGGRFLVRSNPAKIYEAGMDQRVVLVEFDNLDK